MRASRIQSARGLAEGIQRGAASPLVMGSMGSRNAPLAALEAAWFQGASQPFGRWGSGERGKLARSLSKRDELGLGVGA